MGVRQPFSISFLLLVLGLLAGPSCGAAAPSVRPYSLENLPEKEIWVGLTLGDAKVGYGHLSVQPAGAGLHEIRSEMVTVLRMLGIEKTIEMRARDVVRTDLTLVEFEAEILMDGNRLRLAGRTEGSRLLLDLENAGVASSRQLSFSGRLVPASAVGYLPLIEGLEPGRTYRFLAFSPDSLRIVSVEQRLEADSTMADAVFAVQARMDGQDSVTWLDAAGRVVVETAMRGLLRATPRTAWEAKAFLAAARESGQELLVKLSLVPTDRAVPQPRRIDRMSIVLEGIAFDPPPDIGQRCLRHAENWECEIGHNTQGNFDGDHADWLRSSFTVPATDPAIRRLSGDLTSTAPTAEAKVQAILKWLDANIRKESADGFTALDVLATRRAECQGHAYLYAALARASGVPTRVVNGLVYSGAHQGFLYHTWTESLLGDGWRVIDPTFGQLIADATHVKLIEGEDYADIAPIMNLIGRVTARVKSYEYRP